MAPPAEGALAPDLSRGKVEPLRELPGRRKRERNWKDEVRDRVKVRRENRSTRRAGHEEDLQSELPLGDAFDPAASEAAALIAEPPTLETPEASAPRPVELGEDAIDLPLRADSPSPTLRRGVGEHTGLGEVGEPHRAVELGEAAREEEAAEDEWALGAGEDAEAAAPVERPAGLFERGLAGVLDAALLVALSALVVYFAGRVARVPLAGLRPVWMYLAGYLAFLAVAYGAYFTGTTGQTPGKMAGRLRVVDVAGRPPGYPRAFVRALLGGLGVLVALGGLVPMLVDPARRALHDRLLGTRVVRF